MNGKASVAGTIGAKQGVIALIAIVLALCVAAAIASAALAPRDRAYADSQQPAGTTLGSQATAQESYTVKTGDYRFKIPKYWRGKVEWTTTEYANTGGSVYGTAIYLKGHVGDNNYLLARVGSSRTNLPGPGHNWTDSIPVTMTKEPKRLYLLVRNWPCIIWNEKNKVESSYYPSLSKAELNKLSKMVTGGKVSYSKALKSAKAGQQQGNSAFSNCKHLNTASEYMKKAFSTSMKIL